MDRTVFRNFLQVSESFFNQAIFKSNLSQIDQYFGKFFFDLFIDLSSLWEKTNAFQIGSQGQKRFAIILRQGALEILICLV
ncbi:TPA: DUF4080 domain-containing protein [Streptococcus suis]|uniref:DUF4080 domain-containing protein n=1 Tax=Streptococcus suis TaxID=1307 RepID=UPI0034294F4E